MSSFASGILQGASGAMDIYTRYKSIEADKEDRTLRREQLGLQRRLTEQQLAKGDREAAQQARLDAIDAEIAGTPGAELAGPEVPGQDRVQSGLSVPAKAPLQGAAMYDAFGRKALLRNDVAGYQTAKTMQRQEGINEAIANGLKMAETPGYLSEQLPQMFRSHRSISVSKPDADGFQFVTVGDQTPVKLSAMQMKHLAVAQSLQERGFGAEALSYLTNVDKDLAETVAKANELELKVLQSNTQATTGKNDAKYKFRMAGAAERQAAASERSAGAAERRADADIGIGRIGAVQWLQDKDGNVRAYLPNATKDGVGLSEFKTPEGMRPFKPQANEGPKVNPDGSVVINGKLFVPDPKVPGKFMAAKGLEPSALDRAIEADLKGQGVAPTPAGGMAGPGQVQVPNRPFYNATTDELMQIAKKPRGVSTAEAMAAQEELDARKGEARMSAF